MATRTPSVLFLLLLAAVVVHSSTSAGSGPPPPPRRPASTSPLRRLLLRGGAGRDGRVSRDTAAPANHTAEAPRPPAQPPTTQQLQPPPPPPTLPPPSPPPTCPAYCQQPDSSPHKFSALPMGERLRTAAAFLSPAIIVILVVGVSSYCLGRRATRSAVTAAVTAAQHRARQEAQHVIDTERDTNLQLRSQLIAKNKELHDLGVSSRRMGLLRIENFDKGEGSGDREEVKRVNREKETIENLLLKQIEKGKTLEKRVQELEAARRRNEEEELVHSRRTLL